MSTGLSEESAGSPSHRTASPTQVQGQAPVDENRRGLVFGAAAYAAWGLFPLYWPLLQPAGSLEILAHRMVWSLLFAVVVLLVRPRRGWWARLRRSPATVGYLAVAGLVITVNWGTYIWAVNHNHVVETALGYYINPLVIVLVGVALFGERLNRVQWTAIGLAGIAVVILTVSHGRPPWVAFILALSFTTYAYCKKKANVAAIESLMVETSVVTPLALGYLLWLQVQGTAAFGHHGAGQAVLLAGAGVVTAIPLLLFAGAATRVPMTLLGILQYLAPTLQFLLGVVVFHEPMPPDRLVGFGFVWLAVIVFTWDGLRRRRRTAAGKAVRSAVPVPVTEPD
ncbi:chloramphenicol-sensitive protein RarD [Actinopolymorpha cephalotaxi]|uniref:Chloramphenicol-sensitive protein RarD n=1 Tax=Actinopolymorpha cephalotaxi TaxID=504797 RepID=A0A1I2NTE7_9ACTN|nr:EamA family transporter RarD [Actinopolymorpha cephalotaxi]NYH85454.1 chloramphenicol-sensitive protein RarD [Actinopolymorpha cephalotaxi]SFG04706.1 chloramphenicol-sensitive protein RarD [Actinopolymorpha cephalotaxi]